MPPGDFEPTNHAYLLPTEEFDTPGMVGGLARVWTAAVALNIGDVVILVSGTVDNVTKLTTDAEHIRRAGIVVGGTKTFMKAQSSSTIAGVNQAAAIGEKVIVMTHGVAWAVAQAALTRGQKVRPDTTTAGRVLGGTDTTDLAAGITGKIVGNTLDAAAAPGDKVRILVALG